MNWEKLDPERWNHTVSLYAGKTFFHSYEWYQVWQIYLECDIEGRLINNNNDEVFLPFICVKKAKNQIIKYMSGPAGTYGGFLFNPTSKFDPYGLAKEMFGSKSFELYQSYNSLITTKEYERTYILYLESEINETIGKWSSTVKRKWRKSLKYKPYLNVEPTEDEEEWKKFHPIYKTHLLARTNHKYGGYDYKLFSLIKDIIPKKNRSLYLVKYKNEIIGGKLIFFYGDTAYYWIGSVSDEYKNLGITQLIFYLIMNDLTLQGFRIMDFLPSNGIKGVESFKKSYGTEEKLIPIIRSSSIPYKLYQKYLTLRK